MHQTYYEMLGVRRDASPDEIKRAYRRLIAEHHPDRHVLNEEKKAAAEEIAKRINMAYHVLSDPKMRHKYDHDLRYGASYASANQTFTEPSVTSPAQPYRPQFRWKAEPIPTAFNPETRRWIVGFIVIFTFCSLLPLIVIIIGRNESPTRFTPTPAPTVTLTPDT